MKPPCVTMFSCFHARFDSPTFNGSRGLSPRPTLLPQPTSPQVRFPWFDGVVVDFTVKGQMGGDPWWPQESQRQRLVVLGFSDDIGLLRNYQGSRIEISARLVEELWHQAPMNINVFMAAYGLIVAPRDILLHGQQHQQCLMIGWWWVFAGFNHLLEGIYKIFDPQQYGDNIDN